VERNPEQLQSKDRRGFSVVRLARQHNRKEIAAYLLEKGAEDAEGLTKLWLAGKSVQREDWKGATFRNVSFKGSAFNDIDMSEVVFQNMNFKGSTFINM